MTSMEHMDRLLDSLTPGEVEECLGYVTMMHRTGHMPEAEATAWVKRILARAAFLQMGTGTTPAD